MMRVRPALSSLLLLATGLFLLIAPLVLRLPQRADAGADLMDDLRPVMQPEFGATSSRYVNDVNIIGTDLVPVFTPEAVDRFQGYLRITEGLTADFDRLVLTLAPLLGMTAPQLQAVLGQTAPGVSTATAQFPRMTSDLRGVVGVMEKDAGLVQSVPAMMEHFNQVLTRVERNQANFAEADKLPLRGLTWFFMVPGALVTGLAALQVSGLVRRRGGQRSALATRKVSA